MAQKKKKKPFLFLTYGPVIGFSILLCISLFILSTKLGHAPLENWDESWYGQATKEMLATGDFFIPHWDYMVWLDKPPMYMWFASLFSVLFGLSELTVRMPSLISALILIALVTYTSYKKYGLLPATLSYAVLAFSPLFIWRARSGNIDLLVTLLIFLCYFVYQSKYIHKFLVLGFLLGCVYLTKASIVLFPLGIFVLSELLYERDDMRVRAKQYLWCILTFLAMGFIWLTHGYAQVGYSFVEYFLFKSDQGVGSLHLLHPNLSYLRFATQALQKIYIVAFIFGVCILIKTRNKKDSFVLLCFSVLLLIQLSFTQRSNNWYLIPAMPFWALVVGLATYTLLKRIPYKNLAYALTLAVVCMMSVYSIKTSLIPIINTASVWQQRESGIKLKSLTTSTDTIIRIDHLYPATIFYSDRRVLASPPEADKTERYWLSRKQLHTQLMRKKVRWIIGRTTDIKRFVEENKQLTFKIYMVNAEEAIAQVMTTH